MLVAQLVLDYLQYCEWLSKPNTWCTCVHNNLVINMDRPTVCAPSKEQVDIRYMHQQVDERQLSEVYTVLPKETQWLATEGNVRHSGLRSQRTSGATNDDNVGNSHNSIFQWCQRTNWPSSSHRHQPLQQQQDCINGLVYERRNSIANALELRLSCTNPSIWDLLSSQ